MKQTELEKKVKEVFAEQGFELEKKGKFIVAESEEARKEIQVFSSEEHSPRDVMNKVKEDKLVFVDEEFSEIEEKIENRVSILKSDKKEDYETPSYELIGDIALINELDGVSKDEAVEAIRNYHPRVKTVLLKKEPLSGEFRVGEYDKLYGEETETIHKEFGCRFKVDPTKVYYSERFSTERNRVVSQIEEGEKVLVMFAGVGPYAIMAAKIAKPDKVVAVEKNPKAVEYLRENVKLNDIEDIVEVHEGDVKDVLPALEEDFDRIVMPLPGSADEYLNLAISKSRKGTLIHYYRFEEDSNNSEIVDVFGSDVSILERVDCGDRGPSLKRVCYDVKIE